MGSLGASRQKASKMWPCVKRFSSASKSTASRSHRSTRKRQGPKERPETEFEKTGTCWIWTKRVLR